MTPARAFHIARLLRGDAPDVVQEDAWDKAPSLEKAQRTQMRREGLTDAEWSAFERRSAVDKLVIRDGDDDEWGLFAAGLGV